MSLPSQPFYKFGPFQLEPAERLLLRDGERVTLPPKAFETLVLLVQNSGHAVNRDRIMQTVWPGAFVEENNLTQHISLLRKVLRENTNGHEYIETVPRLGYRFVAPVRQASIGDAELLLRRHTRTHITLHEQEEAIDEVAGAASRSREKETKPGSWRTPVWAALILSGLAGAAVLRFVFRPAPVPAVLGVAQLTHDGLFKRGPLFADGEFVYLVEPKNGKTILMRVPATGGELTAELEMPATISPEDLSPSRHELLAREWTDTGQEPPLLSCVVPGGPCRRLNEVTASLAAWSPSGDRIFYGQRGTVFTAKGDGSDPRQLFVAPGAVVGLSSSPDGKLLRYLCEKKDAKEQQFWERRSDGSHEHLIFSHVQSEFHYRQGTWTPDAKYLFVTQAQDGRESLWALRAAQLFGDETRTLLNTGLMSISSVTPAADGKRMFAIGTLARVEFLRWDPRSGSLATFLAGVSADGLAFSPQGGLLAYTTFPGGTLVRSRADGSERRELSPSSQKALSPAWSPDGRRIAYMARASSGPWNGPWKINVVSSEGGAAEELLPGAADQGNPTWSPDGNYLVFAGVPWVKGFAPDSTSIYQMDLRTRKVTALPDSQGLWSPRWSPDGRFLVAETVDSRKLLLFDFAKRTWRPLAEVSAAIIGYTSWSHDSRFLFFNAYMGEQSAVLYRVDVLGRVTGRFPMPESVLEPIAQGQWFTLAPDDVPLVLHDISVRELFAFDLRLP